MRLLAFNGLFVCALDNGVSRTPAMGWSSWNHFAGKVNEKILLDAADALVSSGLREVGYEYINLDDGWATHRDSQGLLVADTEKFPRGLKFIADYLHERGLKFGIYTARGNLTCMGRPGSDGWERQDAQTFADWGVDYLKEDSCYGTGHGSVWDQYARMRDALNATGRPIYFSVTQAVPYKDAHEAMHCPGVGGLDVVFTTKPWVAQGLDPGELANAFLVEYCNNADAFGQTGGRGGFLSQLDSQQYLTYDNLTRPGAFSDMDMLEVCNGHQSAAEYRAQFSTWVILTSPLILGNDLTNMSAACLEIVMNRDLIAVLKDPMVKRGRLVYPERMTNEVTVQVWSKPLHDGGFAVVAFNRSPRPESVAILWSWLVDHADSCAVRDLWLHRELGRFAASVNTTVPPHDVVALKVYGCTDQSIVV